MKKYILLPFYTLFVSLSLVFAQENQQDFYNAEKIQDIKLVFKKQNWQSVLDSLKVNGEEVLLGTITIGSNTYNNVGVRYAGSKSFKYGGERNSFKIKLNQISHKQNHQGVKNVRLSNALRDPSMVREVLGYEIARNYTQAPRANYARLYVNGEYRGLFVNVEHVGKEFLQNHFETDSSVFFKATIPNPDKKTEKDCLKNISGTLVYEKDANCYMNNYDIKSEHGWDELIQLTKTLSKDMKNIEKKLDVDQTLWMHAFNNVLVNLDSYAGDLSGNYYLCKDKHGRFVPVIRDLNLAFGSYKNIKLRSRILSLSELQTLDPMLHSDNKYKPLISKLLENPLYKKMYLSHIKTILEDYFLDGQYEKRAKELQRLISSDLMRDKYREYNHNQFLSSLTTTHGKRSKIPGITELMSKRTRFLKKHKLIRAFAPSIETVNIKKRKKFSRNLVETFKVSTKVEEHARKVRIFYRYNKDDMFKSAYMLDDGKHNDKKAGDKIFGVEIKPPAGVNAMEYYIMAENAMSVSFYPSHYMFAPKEITLEELNK